MLGLDARRVGGERAFERRDGVFELLRFEKGQPPVERDAVEVRVPLCGECELFRRRAEVAALGAQQADVVVRAGDDFLVIVSAALQLRFGLRVRPSRLGDDAFDRSDLRELAVLLVQVGRAEEVCRLLHVARERFRLQVGGDGQLLLAFFTLPSL